MIHCLQHNQLTQSTRGSWCSNRAHALLFLMSVLILCACQPRIVTHGFMPRDELIEQLSPGDQDKHMVSQLMGTPSSLGLFDDDVWYYVTQRTENMGFLKPLLTDQQVLALEFDEQGILQSIERYGLEEAQLIEPLDGKTPTVGRKLTILQQLFGNFGRFTDDDGGVGGYGP